MNAPELRFRPVWNHLSPNALQVLPALWDQSPTTGNPHGPNVRVLRIENLQQRGDYYHDDRLHYTKDETVRLASDAYYSNNTKKKVVPPAKLVSVTWTLSLGELTDFQRPVPTTGAANPNSRLADAIEKGVQTVNQSAYEEMRNITGTHWYYDKETGLFINPFEGLVTAMVMPYGATSIWLGMGRISPDDRGTLSTAGALRLYEMSYVNDCDKPPLIRAVSVSDEYKTRGVSDPLAALFEQLLSLTTPGYAKYTGGRFVLRDRANDSRIFFIERTDDRQSLTGEGITFTVERLGTDRILTARISKRSPSHPVECELTDPDKLWQGGRVDMRRCGWTVIAGSDWDRYENAAFRGQHPLLLRLSRTEGVRSIFVEVSQPSDAEGRFPAIPALLVKLVSPEVLP